MKMRYRNHYRKSNKKKNTVKIILLTLAGLLLLSGLVVYAILYNYISKINFIDKHDSPYESNLSPDYSDLGSVESQDADDTAESFYADNVNDAKAVYDTEARSGSFSEAAGSDSGYGAGENNAGYNRYAGTNETAGDNNSYADNSEVYSGYNSQTGQYGYNALVDYYTYLSKIGVGLFSPAEYSNDGASLNSASGTGGYDYMQESKEANTGNREGKDIPVLKQETNQNQGLTETGEKQLGAEQILSGRQSQGVKQDTANNGKAFGSNEAEPDKGKNRSDDIEPIIEPIRDDKVMNFLLIGQDLPSKNSSINESFALFTVNKRSKKLITTSFYSNLYLYIPGVGKERLATAYKLGGADLLIKTLEKNFGLVIDGFFMADYSAYIDIVDLIGGVELDISEQELEPVNRNIREINAQLGYREDADLIKSQGKSLLNGKQALGYSRNWYTKDDKFISHGNQKAVILSIINEVRSFNIIKMNAFLNEILPRITTNLSQSRIMELIVMLPMYFNYNIDYLTLPVKGTETKILLDGKTVLDYNSEQNLAQIRSVLYAMK